MVDWQSFDKQELAAWELKLRSLAMVENLATRSISIQVKVEA